MKRILLIITTALIYLSANAQSPKEIWTEANNSYSKADYQSALEGFLKIEKSGYVSSALFYNLGNTYFKMKEIGRSILYYERALKLDPSDKDVINNLQLAREFSLDKVEEIPDFILKTWVKEINYSLSSDTWAYLSIISMVLLALLILMFRYGPTPKARKSSFFGAMASILLIFFSVYFSWSQKHSYFKKDTAIVMKPVSTVKSSPDNSGNTLFILHEGTKLSLIEEIGQWKRVELTDGRQGWINSLDIEVI